MTDGRKFRLKDYDPGDTLGVDIKDCSKELLEVATTRLAEMQDKLYAQDRWSVLLVFQAMDAAGKDGTIKHVMSGINPQGCQVFSFKNPSSMELDHDFLWRTNRCLPERGRIGIFNRLGLRGSRRRSRAPADPREPASSPELVTKKIWKERFEDINALERYLARNGTLIRKFFLNVSRKEQRKRFLERLNQPEKNWKFSGSDVKERHYWNDYMDCYEDMIRRTATPWAPWNIIPADPKWFSRLAVAATILDALDSLDLAYPKVDQAKLVEIEAAKLSLMGEAGAKNGGNAKALSAGSGEGGDRIDRTIVPQESGDTPADSNGGKKGKKKKGKGKERIRRARRRRQARRARRKALIRRKTENEDDHSCSDWARRSSSHRPWIGLTPNPPANSPRRFRKQSTKSSRPTSPRRTSSSSTTRTRTSHATGRSRGHPFSSRSPTSTRTG